MKEAAHIQIKPAVGCFSHFAWTLTVIAPSHWQVLYFNEKKICFYFIYLLLLLGLPCQKIFSLSTLDAA